MNNLDVNTLGVSELNENELMEINGGLYIHVIFPIKDFVIEIELEF